MDWADPATAERFLARSRKKKSKRNTGRPDKDRKADELERHEEQGKLLKRAKEQWAKKRAEAYAAHANLEKFDALLRRELKLTAMPRLGQIDWDVVDAIERLGLAELPLSPRQIALGQFSKFLKRVTRRVFGEDMGDPLPEGLGGWPSDYDSVKAALRLTTYDLKDEPT